VSWVYLILLTNCRDFCRGLKFEGLGWTKDYFFFFILMASL
jgi:hypothetical protein